MFSLIFLLGHIVLVTELTARPSSDLAEHAESPNIFIPIFAQTLTQLFFNLSKYCVNVQLLSETLPS